jgi:hypothetical protein
MEASPATTFDACSSPALTRVKPQPAPAILSEESVHTTLSITHHIRKRPSIGPQTTYGPQWAEHAGFGGLPTQPSEDGFLVWASKPCPKAQHDGDGIRASGSFEAEDTRRDHMACVGRTRGAAKAWPSDGKTTTDGKSSHLPHRWDPIYKP